MRLGEPITSDGTVKVGKSYLARSPHNEKWRYFVVIPYLPVATRQEIDTYIEWADKQEIPATVVKFDFEGLSDELFRKNGGLKIGELAELREILED